MSRRLLAVVLLAVATCLPMPSIAQEPDPRPLAERLTAEQLRETGLDTLTPAQLARLDAILRGEIAGEVAAATRAAEARAEDAAKSRRGRDREPVVSRIVGPFAGWEPGTRFTLANGQTWRAIESSYYVPKSKISDGPAVVVQPGLVSGFYMQIEGHNQKAKVQRVD